MDVLTLTAVMGFTHATLVPSGIWWQREYEHSLPKDVPALALRVDKPLSDVFSVGAGVVWAGRFKSHARAVASDQAYDARVPYPLSDWYGDQRIRSAFVVGRYRFRDSAWYVEGGAAVTRTNWNMTIPNYVQCAVPECLKPDVYPAYRLVVGGNQNTVDLVAGAGYRFNERLSVQAMALPSRVADAAWGPGITKGYSIMIGAAYTF